MVKLGDKVIQNETYAYDANHNLINQNNVNYTFDALNRLTSGYAYDKAGNITSGNGLTMTYDKDSRLQSINKVATTSDADGNLTAYTVAGKAHKATYNSQNQLTAYDGTTYTYDANGNRLTAGAQTFTTDATGQVLADKDNQYVYGAQGLIGYYDKTGKFVTVTSDNRGDILNLLDESGTVRGTMSYSDYGAVTKTTGTVDTPFKYARRLGVITDSNGLVYLKTRYYNPQLMRFMNRDTVAGSVTDSQSLNRFSYVEGNPLTYVDLNGQARTWLTSYDGLHGVLDALGFIPVLGNATAMLSIGLDLATGHYDAVFADAVGLLPLGHVAGVIGGVALAHIATPLVTKAVAHATVVKAGFVAGGIRKAENSFGTKVTNFASRNKPIPISKVSKPSFDTMYIDDLSSKDNMFFSFSSNYKNATPKPKTSNDFVQGFRLQGHHIGQNDVMEKSAEYNGLSNYNKYEAPVITIPTGAEKKNAEGLIIQEERPHTTISNIQNKRNANRQKSSIGIEQIINESRQDLVDAGFSEKTAGFAQDIFENYVNTLR